MYSLENNIAKEKYCRNNTSLMKNVLYSSQVALEQFKHDLEPDLHPVNNKLVANPKRYIAISGTNLYSVDLSKNLYLKLSSSCFNEKKKPHHGCAIVSDSNN